MKSFARKKEQYIARMNPCHFVIFNTLTYASVGLKTHRPDCSAPATNGHDSRFYTWYGNSGFRTTASSLIAAWCPLLLSHHAMNNLYATLKLHQTFFKFTYAWKAHTKGMKNLSLFHFQISEIIVDGRTESNNTGTAVIELQVLLLEKI